MRHLEQYFREGDSRKVLGIWHAFSDGEKAELKEQYLLHFNKLVDKYSEEVKKAGQFITIYAMNGITKEFGEYKGEQADIVAQKILESNNGPELKFLLWVLEKRTGKEIKIRPGYTMGTRKKLLKDFLQ